MTPHLTDILIDCDPRYRNLTICNEAAPPPKRKLPLNCNSMQYPISTHLQSPYILPH